MGDKIIFYVGEEISESMEEEATVQYPDILTNAPDMNLEEYYKDWPMYTLEHDPNANTKKGTDIAKCNAGLED